MIISTSSRSHAANRPRGGSGSIYRRSDLPDPIAERGPNSRPTTNAPDCRVPDRDGDQTRRTIHGLAEK